MDKRKTETDKRIEAIEKRMHELIAQQDNGTWSKRKGTGGNRGGGGDEWQPKCIVVFACKWAEKEGPKAVGRTWITNFLRAAQEALVAEHGECYKEVFGKWKLLHMRSYKVEVEVKDPEMVWELRSALAKLIDGTHVEALRGPKGDPVRIGVERSRKEKARFKWLAALEGVLQGSLTRLVTQGTRVLPSGKSVSDVLKSDGRSFNIMAVDENGSEAVVVHIAKDLTMQEVDEEMLQALGMSKEEMSTQLRAAVGGR